MQNMFPAIAAVAGLMTAIFGAAMGYLAGSLPMNRERLETVAGALLISGFALFGIALGKITCSCF
jgi:VIT1/CCC1 family predicted Fe2+/Mn2+ transporter